jgi:hypothetical protein
MPCAARRRNSQVTEPTMRCPYCGEEILAVAIKCKHCGSALPPADSVADVTSKKPNVDCAWILLGIPLAGTLLIWGWVGNMSLLQAPAQSLTLIMVLVIVCTAAAAAFERSQAPKVPPRANGPGQWGAFVLLMWLVGYPAYLFARRRYGLANMLLPAIFVTVLFLGSAWAMNAIIESRVLEIKTKLGAFAPQSMTAPFPEPSSAPSSPAEASHPLPVPQPSGQARPQTADNDRQLNQAVSASITRYCSNMAANVGGSYVLEQSCHEQEVSAWMQVTADYDAHRIPEQVYQYCRDMATNVGGSYVLERSCVEQEMAAKQSLEQGAK